ncbi:hypothetical protein EVAR_79195_1 [Eumeta japonica]|uniref:Uncharacterized protein n=1 Tax=Eumeta variegata TaxID=151549 RepID=A0A4C1UUI6_EUMVA|nr:hypothetical protein EVAR_79195_1 [Eumeta japonica]
MEYVMRRRVGHWNSHSSDATAEAVTSQRRAAKRGALAADRNRCPYTGSVLLMVAFSDFSDETANIIICHYAVIVIHVLVVAVPLVR